MWIIDKQFNRKIEGESSLDSLAEHIVHNKATNTTELGGNVEIDGNLKVNGHAMLDLTGLVVDELPSTGYDGQIIIKRNGSWQTQAPTKVVAGNSYHLKVESSASGFVGKINIKDISNIETSGTITYISTGGEKIKKWIGFNSLYTSDGKLSVAKHTYHEIPPYSVGVYKDFVGELDFEVEEEQEVPDSLKTYITEEVFVTTGFDLYCYKNGEWHRVDLDD